MATLSEIKNTLDRIYPNLKPASGVPVGAIVMMNTVGDGYLLCNGQAVSRYTYSELFSAIGTKYGSGNGSSTFNVPNLDGRFLEATTSSSKVGDKVSAGLPNITGKLHAISGTGGYTGAFKIAGNATSVGGGGTHYYGSQYADINASRCSPVYGKSNTVQPESTRLYACIKF